MPETSTQADLATLTLPAETGGRAFFFRKGSSDEEVIQQTFTQRHYDLSWLSQSRHAELMTYVEKRVADGSRPLIVDAGANIGASPVFFAFALPQAKVVAIEPEIQPGFGTRTRSPLRPGK